MLHVHAGDAVVKFHAHQQALAADILHPGQGSQLLHEVGAHLFGVGGKIPVKQLVDLGQQGLGNGVGIVEGVHNIAHLIPNSGDHFVVTVTCGVYRNTRIKVKISLAVFIIDILILCCFCQKIKALVSLDHVMIDFVLNILGRQTSISQFHLSAAINLNQIITPVW